MPLISSGSVDGQENERFASVLGFALESRTIQHPAMILWDPCHSSPFDMDQSLAWNLPSKEAAPSHETFKSSKRQVREDQLRKNTLNRQPIKRK